MIRSRAERIDEGERGTKYFCTLETTHFLDKTIKKVHTANNEIITDQKNDIKSIANILRGAFQKLRC